MRVQDRKFLWKAADFREGDAGAAFHCHHPANPFNGRQRSPLAASMHGRRRGEVWLPVLESIKLPHEWKPCELMPPPLSGKAVHFVLHVANTT